jgi:integrase
MSANFRQGENQGRTPPCAGARHGKESQASCYVSDQISAFMAALRAREAVAARGLDFMILTAARTGLSPRRSFGGESIFQAKVWVVPPSRMKSGREPRVPLSRAVISVLKVQAHHQDDGSARETPIEHGHVFGAWTSQVMAHGFRSTFRDWAAECTNFPREGALSLEIVSVESSICNGEQRPTSA